jgi:hypothetical protein
MIRARFHFKLKSGDSWNDFLQTASKLNEISRARGWVEFSFWTQVAGSFNEIVLEADYPDLATFEQQTNAFYADAEAVGAMRGWRDLVIQGTGYSELWAQAEPVSG